MDHNERMSLAQALCIRMAALHGDTLLLGGVYGSTANGSDTPWSDLELLCVLREGQGIDRREFLLRGVAVTMTIMGQGKMEALLTHPAREWPFWMGVLQVLWVLQGDASQVQAWLEMGQAVPQDRFRRALEMELPGLVVESYGRILSCRERGNRADIGCAVLEVLFEMRDALCLLNRRWVTHDYLQGLLDTFGFPLLPEGYRELVLALWWAREIEEIVPPAERLYTGYRRLLEEEGIRWPDHADPSEVAL